MARGLPPLPDRLREFLEDSARDFEDAGREEEGADFSSTGHGPCGTKAEARVVELMRMTRWKILAVNSHRDPRRTDILARKGRSTYIVHCVFGGRQVLMGLVDAYASRYREAKQAVRANGLMLISPRAEVPEESRTSFLLRNRGERIEFLGERTWVDELRRPTSRAGSTSDTELTVMSVLAFSGAGIVLAGLYLRLNFLLLGAGYLVYILGAVGVIVGTIFKYRDL